MPINEADVKLTYTTSNTPPASPDTNTIYFCNGSKTLWVGNPQYGLLELSKSATNSFTDGIDSLFKDVKANIQAVQAGSGTPSPTNVRAISGFTECTVWDRQINQWDEEWELGRINLDTGAKVSATGQIRAKNYIKIRPNDYYYTKCLDGIWFAFYDANYNIVTTDLPTGEASESYGRLLRNTVWKAPATANYILFYLVVPYGTTYNHDISINYPSTDTDYHAYNGTTATISFGSAGTVYGGTVDLTSGTLTVDRGYVKGTNSNINRNTGTSWYVDKPSDIKVTGEEQRNVLLSNVFDNSQMFIHPLGYIRFNTTSEYASVNDLLTAIPDIEFVYPLATPQTYQLTPAQLRSLVGANNLTSNTGDTVDVEYITNETIAWLLDNTVRN